MKRIHPLIKATILGASLSLSMTAFAAGNYGSSSGSTSSATEAERAQRMDSQTGVGQTTGPAAGSPGATGSTGASGSVGATGRTMSPSDSDVRSTDPSGAAAAEAAQRRDSQSGVGQTTGPQAGPTAGGERGGGGGTYDSTAPSR